jgi:hypothetical protein
MESKLGSAIAPVYNPAYPAAFALDPYYADIEDEKHCIAKPLPGNQIQDAMAVVQRVSGDIAAAQFSRLFTTGFPAEMQPFVLSIAQERSKAEGLAVSGTHQKRARVIVPSAKERFRVWQKFGSAVPELRDVAKRLLLAHATSAASERNWSLWGRIYKASRSTLGMRRATSLIAICQAQKATLPASDEFDISLQVVEENV